LLYIFIAGYKISQFCNKIPSLNRLKIPTPQSERKLSRRGTKRGREDSPPEVENVAAGCIEVEECDLEGKYIKLKNTSENVYNLYLKLILL